MVQGMRWNERGWRKGRKTNESDLMEEGEEEEKEVNGRVSGDVENEFPA